LKQAALKESEQLPLQIESRPAAALPYRLRPMSPVTGDAPFDDPEWFFEPWWPGASALAYIDGTHLRLQTEHLADPLTAFPELRGIGEQFTDDRLIVEGALLVLDDGGRPDSDLLRLRLADPLARRGVPAFVASDLLYERGQPILTRPFEERRQRLGRQLADGDRCVISRGIRGEGWTLAEAVASMGIGEISARLLSAPYRPGVQDPSWLRLPVVETPVVPTRPLLALLQRLPL
jgi:bifunctional non-homologous end joining protein LigD